MTDFRDGTLAEYGWNEAWADAFTALGDATLEPARVLFYAAAATRLVTASGESGATFAGRLRHAARSGGDLPAVGDWVAIRRSGAADARIEHVLPRRTRLSRKVAGKRTVEQVVAANLDAALVVMGLDHDFNPRRLERLLTTVWESGARPIVLLNKLDLCAEPAARRREVERAAPGVPVLLASCLEVEGVGAVRDHLPPRQTAVLVGSSGVGKSTLINLLLGESVQATRGVREADSRGRHTTTRRELFKLPHGGLLIDNPGVREVQLWSGETSLEQAFVDIATLAGGCRFRDCAHETETGCAVRAAVEQGALEPSRLDSYRALRAELRYLELRQDGAAQRAERSRWRTIHKELKRFNRRRGES